MKKVFLHGELGKRFGSEWDLHVKSPIEAVHALFANNPKIEKYLNQKHQENIYYGIKKEGSEDFAEKEEYFLESNKDFHVFPLAQGASLGALVMTAINTAASMYISKKMAEAMERDDATLQTQTKSYIYNGTQNRYQQGSSIPVGYGTLKVGPNVISSCSINYDFDSEKGKIFNFSNGLYSLIPEYHKHYIADLGPLFSCFAQNSFDGSSKYKFIDPAFQYLTNTIADGAFGTTDGIYGGFEEVDAQKDRFVTMEKKGNAFGGYYYYTYNFAKGVNQAFLGNFHELGNWYPSLKLMSDEEREAAEAFRLAVSESNSLKSAYVCLQSKPLLETSDDQKVFYPISFVEQQPEHLGGDEPSLLEESRSFPLHVGQRWREKLKSKGVGWHKLESTSVLKSLDLISEGEIGGFADTDGSELVFDNTSVSSLPPDSLDSIDLRNEKDDYLKAVYLDETPVKEVSFDRISEGLDAYNINEFDIDVSRNEEKSIGSEDQKLLEPQYLFTAYTKEINGTLYGPRTINQKDLAALVPSNEFVERKIYDNGEYVTYQEDGASNAGTYRVKVGFNEKFDPSGNYYSGDLAAESESIIYEGEPDNADFYAVDEAMNEYEVFSGEYVNYVAEENENNKFYEQGDKVRCKNAIGSMGYYKMGENADKFLGVYDKTSDYNNKQGHLIMKETIRGGPNNNNGLYIITGNDNPLGSDLSSIASGLTAKIDEFTDYSNDPMFVLLNPQFNEAIQGETINIYNNSIDIEDGSMTVETIGSFTFPSDVVEEVDITPGEVVDTEENLWKKIEIKSPIKVEDIDGIDLTEALSIFEELVGQNLDEIIKKRFSEENYLSHTIINPLVEQAYISLRIDELGYIYQGDEVEVEYKIGELWTYLLAAMSVYRIYQVSKSVTSAIFHGAISKSAFGSLGAGIGPAGLAALGLLGSENATHAAEKTSDSAAGGLLSAVLLALLAAISKNHRFKIGTKIENSGEIWPNRARFRIKYGNEGEQLYSTDVYIFGIATSAYQKDIKIYFPPNPNQRDRIIKVFKLNRERNTVKEGEQAARYKEKMSLASVTEITPAILSYPNSVIIGTRINAKDQPSIPKRNYNLRLKKVQVPSNYDTETRQYTGNWNGVFNPELKWTNNPAWCLYDLISNKRFGVGKFGIKQENIDRWTLYKIAKYCDELVLTGYSPKYQKRKPTKVDDIEGLATYHFDLEVESFSLEFQHIGKQLSLFHEDGSYESIKIEKANPSEKTISLYSEPKHENFECAVSIDYPILEPRYTLNAFIMNQENAFKLINEFAVIFRAYAYWSGGAINFFQDEKKEAVMLFSNNNISDKGFSYSSTPRTSRSNSCNIKYIDRYNKYRPKIEHAEDIEAIEENGFVEQSVDGFGITSQAQAKRAAEFIIKGANLETEMITFSTNMVGSYLKPGDIIDVLDNKKTVGRFAGKIIEAESHPRGLFAELTLDYPIYTFIDRYDKETWKTIKIYQPTGNETIESLDSTQEVTDKKIDNIRAKQIGEFLIYDTSEDNTKLKIFNNVFSFVTGEYKWTEAIKDAKQRGGKLASIEDQDTQFLIESILPTGEVGWIGGYNKETPPPEELIWYTSSSCSDDEITYSNWAEDFPKFTNQLTTDLESEVQPIVTDDPELGISADVDGSFGNFLAISGSDDESKHGSWIHMEHTVPTGYILQNYSSELLDNIEDSEGASFYLEDQVNYANAKQYKILNIKEESNGIFSIQGLEYNVDKFDNIEKDLSINKPNYPVIFNEDSLYNQS